MDAPVGCWKRHGFESCGPASIPAGVISLSGSGVTGFPLRQRRLTPPPQSAAEEDGRIYFRLLKDGWQAIRFSIQGDCRLGFDDPALVAWMQGAFYASGLAERCPALDIKADYSQAGFWGIAEVGVEVRLMKLIIPAARFGKAKFGQFMKRRTRRGRNYGRCECDGIDRGVV